MSSTSSSVDGFLAHFDTSGNWQDVLHKGNPLYITMNSLDIDKNGRIHTLGYEGNLYGNSLDPTTLFFSEYQLNTLSIDTIGNVPDDLYVYPNPTTRKIFIDFGKFYENITVKIRDLLGQTISEYRYDEI